MVEYNSDTLRKVQLIELKMLLKIDKICKRHNVKYRICGGTLLGAVRHKGFIPWDDDVDIDMMRNDYNKFLKIADKELSKEYFIQNYETDSVCLNASFTKIRKNGTLLESEGQRHLDRHKGICIDIFPIDIVPESLIMRKIHKNILIFLQKLVAIKLKFNYYNKNFFKKNITIILSLLLRGTSIRFIGKTMEKLRTMFNNSESQLIANTYNGTVYEKWTFNKEVYGEPVLLEFEKYKFPAPERWEEVLTQFYGDYMTLPPEDERWNYQHKIIKLDFGE